jgi:hypothetical protein
MRNNKPEIKEYEMQISIADFLKSYNQNMPMTFPRATLHLLKRFRDDHATLFKHGDLWSLDLHRKKLIEWLPRNSGVK